MSFTAACAREAGEVPANDTVYAETLETLAARVEQDRIRNDMLLAAEQLEASYAGHLGKGLTLRSTPAHGDAVGVAGVQSITTDAVSSASSVT